jgi:hypothetical protein
MDMPYTRPLVLALAHGQHEKALIIGRWVQILRCTGCACQPYLWPTALEWGEWVHLPPMTP